MPAAAPTAAPDPVPIARRSAERRSVGRKSASGAATPRLGQQHDGIVRVDGPDEVRDLDLRRPSAALIRRPGSSETRRRCRRADTARAFRCALDLHQRHELMQAQFQQLCVELSVRNSPTVESPSTDNADRQRYSPSGPTMDSAPGRSVGRPANAAPNTTSAEPL